MFNFALSLLGIFLVIVILKYCISRYFGVKNELKSLKEYPIIDPVPVAAQDSPSQWIKSRKVTDEEKAAKKSCYYCPYVSACKRKNKDIWTQDQICDLFPSWSRHILCKDCNWDSINIHKNKCHAGLVHNSEACLKRRARQGV